MCPFSFILLKMSGFIGAMFAKKGTPTVSLVKIHQQLLRLRERSFA